MFAVREKKARAKKRAATFVAALQDGHVYSPVYALKEICVAAKRHMREDFWVRTPLCYFRAASRNVLPEALNRTGSLDEESSSRDTVSTCWSIAPSLTWVNNKRVTSSSQCGWGGREIVVVDPGCRDRHRSSESQDVRVIKNRMFPRDRTFSSIQWDFRLMQDRRVNCWEIPCTGYYSMINFCLKQKPYLPTLKNFK